MTKILKVPDILPALPDGDAWLPRAEAARVADLGLASFAALAMSGSGPSFAKIGGACWYRKSQVLEWATARVRIHGDVGVQMGGAR